jgi:hypothetical protein
MDDAPYASTDHSMQPDPSMSPCHGHTHSRPPPPLSRLCDIPVVTSWPMHSSSFSSASVALPPCTSELSASRRTNPLSAAPHKPLASSTSSENQPPRHSTRSRLSSYSTELLQRKNPSYRMKEPETIALIELLTDASKQVDRNSQKKQHVAARE